MHFCVDYHGVVHMDAHLMPWVDELIDRIGGARYITTLDLARGYWQVPMAVPPQGRGGRKVPCALV